MNELSTGERITDVIDDYNLKMDLITDSMEAFSKAGDALLAMCSIRGTYGQTNINTGRVYESDLRANLTRSAWLYVHSKMNIDYLSSSKDKNKFDHVMKNPPEFTIKNIRDLFGDYLIDPRGNILRGLAEVFAALDSAYKSHSKVKIGVNGLPKRVILPNGFGYNGRDRIKDILNALAAYQNKPLMTYVGEEIDGKFWPGTDIMTKDVEGLKETRGVWFKHYANGNVHMYFTPETLLDINRALAEYYGEVVADAYTESGPKQASTAVSKDLQFYFTPEAAANRLVAECHLMDGQSVLEPSCGEGHLIAKILEVNPFVKVTGIEVDSGRVNKSRAKGYQVAQGNFLEFEPFQNYNHVIMNPPFYGKHYQKHILHALKFLKEDGSLVSILPASARYDHDFVVAGYRATWYDLPMGSFSEAGTNVPTVILTLRKSRY